MLKNGVVDSSKLGLIPKNKHTNQISGWSIIKFDLISVAIIAFVATIIVYTLPQFIFWVTGLAILRDGLRVHFSAESGWKIAAIVLLGGLLARWVWVFFAPPSEVVIPAHQVASATSAENLFGLAATSSVAVAALPNIRLVGVFAGKPGFAIFELDGKRQVSATLGDEIAGSGKLTSVASDSVVIERGGVQQRVSLSGNAAAVKSAKAERSPPLL